MAMVDQVEQLKQFQLEHRYLFHLLHELDLHLTAGIRLHLEDPLLELLELLILPQPA
jgi:hypothetical protein